MPSDLCEYSIFLIFLVVVCVYIYYIFCIIKSDNNIYIFVSEINNNRKFSYTFIL